MARMRMDGILIVEVETKDIMTKSSLPVGGYVTIGDICLMGLLTAATGQGIDEFMALAADG